MNYRDPQLQARLASDYVSGARRGAARRRFEGLMAADAALRREVREWQDDIFPLALSLPPQAPPGRVWRAIRARLRGNISPFTWGWNGVYSWRALSGTLAAAVMVSAIVFPMQLERAVREERMAVLQTPQARAAVVIRADSRGALRARALEDLAPTVRDHSFELWALRPGQAPQSLGLVAAAGATALAGKGALSGVDQLAITLEPPGGSPDGKPTGPIVMSGKLLEI